MSFYVYHFIGQLVINCILLFEHVLAVYIMGRGIALFYKLFIELQQRAK